jgi:hypothetical protein
LLQTSGPSVSTHTSTYRQLCITLCKFASQSSLTQPMPSIAISSSSLTTTDCTCSTDDMLSLCQSTSLLSAELHCTLHYTVYESTGCVLYALSQGTPPFAGGSLSEVIGRILNEQPQGLQQLQGELQQLVTWLLQKVTHHTLITPCE